MSLKKNLVYNVAGMVLPTLLAIAAMPAIIRGLGADQFGLLTLVWVVLGYFSFLDFGVSRSLTNIVARSQVMKLNHPLQHYVNAALVSLLVLVLPLVVLGYAFREPLFPLLFKSSEMDISVAVRTIGHVLLAVPLVIITGVYKGVLEGLERFDITNRIRLPMAVWSYLGPLAVLPFTSRVDWVVLFLILGRVVTLWLFVRATYATLNGREWGVSKGAVLELWRIGGWIGLGSAVSPLMIYIDRFFIAKAAALGKVALYATPMDIFSKAVQPIDAVAGVFYPRLSRTWVSNQAGFEREYNVFVSLLVGLLAPVCAVLAMFGHELLSLWLGESFASGAFVLAAILSIGTFMNGVARGPFVALQASQRARSTALIQAIQLPIYVAALLAAKEHGLLGIALVWTIRVSLDSLLYFVYLGRMRAIAVMACGAAWVTIAAVMGGAGSPLFDRAIVTGIVASVFGFALVMLNLQESKLLVRTLSQRINKASPVA